MALLFFTEADVDRLKSYSYKSLDKGILANAFLNPYWWSTLIEYVPRWVAPNLITLTGFMCVIANVLLLLAYAPDLRGEIPSWCYISFAFGMFAYQSLDAIDGKQARRTGTSSPLGELFDHGCDALNTGLATFLACKALNIEQSWIQVFAILSSVGNFYLSTWEEYFTGVLYLSEFSGPIEGVWSLILVFFVSAAYGPKVWSNTIADVVPESLSGISLFQVQINFAIIAFGFVVILFNIFSSFNNVRAAIASNPASAERAAKFHPLGGLIPFAVTVPLTLVFPVLFSETIIFSSGIVPYTLFLTFIYGNQVGSIIVAHISKRPFPIQAMVAPVATIVTIGVVIVTVYGFMTVQIMWALAALSAIWYFVWFCRVVSDLCHIFDIYCLTIKRDGISRYSALPA